MGWNSIFNFEIRISNILFFFFFLTPGIPRKWFSTCPPGWTSAPATDRSPMKDVRADLACIYFRKISISYKRACRTSTFEIMNLSAQKTRHVNGPSAITKPNAMHAFSFCQLSEMRVKVLDQRAVALVVQTRCADVKLLWESEREKTRYSWITHAVFKWLI